MEIILLDQTKVFIYGAAMGLAMGILYDLFSLFPNTFGRRVLRPLLDILYCLIFMAGFLLLTLVEAGGEIRWYIPGGMVLGLVLYFIGFSAYVRLALEVLGRFLRELAKLFAKIFEKIENLFEYPRGN